MSSTCSSEQGVTVAFGLDPREVMSGYVEFFPPLILLKKHSFINIMTHLVGGFNPSEKY